MKQVAIVLQINDGMEGAADTHIAMFTDTMMAARITASIQQEEWPEWFQHVITRKPDDGCEAGH